MDEATAMQVLKQYGVPPTPENMQRVLQQAPGTDGSAVLGRSMGLQGGMDESGNALDKLAFASQRGTTPNAASVPVAPIPPPQATQPQPQPQPQQRAPIPTPPKQQFGPPEPYGPGTPPAIPATGGEGGGSNWPWLLAALLGTRKLMPDRGLQNVPVPQLAGPEARTAITGPDSNAPRLEAPLKRLTGPDATPVDVMGNITGMQPAAGAPTQEELYGEPKGKGKEAVDKISRASESRRPINTNGDGRNSEPSSKPVNLDTRAPTPGAYDGEPTNLVEEIAKFLKKARK